MLFLFGVFGFECFDDICLCLMLLCGFVCTDFRVVVMFCLFAD